MHEKKSSADFFQNYFFQERGPWGLMRRQSLNTNYISFRSIIWKDSINENLCVNIL